MIKLTLLDGTPIWISIDRIGATYRLPHIDKVQERTLIESGQAGVWWYVKEDPESIVSIIEWTGEAD